MADTDTEPLPNGTGGAFTEEDYEKMNQRPADIDADVRAMERGKRVEALMSSKLFREELERVLDQQLHEGGDAPLLQRIREMVGGRLHSGSFRGPSCVLPINDIRGMEGVGYEKGEKILRCKLAAAYRLVDLFGWTQTGNSGQITARLNTAVEQVLTTPRGVLPHEVTASSLVKVDMQGTVVDQGTTNFPVNVEGFSVHAMVHAARPDLKCVLHVRAPAALAVSSMKDGILPLSTEAALLGDVAYHQVPYGTLDNEEQEKLVRALGPHAKVLILSNDGALCCGATLEEAFYQARNLTAACDVQLRLASLPIERLSLIDDDTRRQIYESSRKPPADQQKWRAGGEEFEALMRMLDNAGFRTGYVYRHPLIKNDVPRPKNDVEVPPAVSSLGYLLEEEELYRQGIWKKGHGKTGERTRWLNSPNVYQKVEVLETGTNDPKKITKWVDANNEEWVQDGSPQHSSTPVKIDTLQFVPKNTNPKEFKKLQQQIKENRRADMISAGPQSHILEGVTWDEAAKFTEDAVNTATGDHVVLMGAASKGIIQRGYQHNATVYSAPYARNPFDRVTDSEIADYRRIVERKQRGIDDTDVSDSEALSGAQFTSPLSETEDESRDEHRVLRIETKQVPVRSQPEIVLSDDFINAERAHSDRTKDPNLDKAVSAPSTPVARSPMVPAVTPALRVHNTVVRGNLANQDLKTNAQALTEALTSNHRSKHDYSRTVNFENAVKKFSSPDNANNVTAVKKFSSPDNGSKNNFDITNTKFGTPDNANYNTSIKKCSSSEHDNTNTTVTFGNVTNITEKSNFYKVRERFNSPDFNEFTSKSCVDIENMHSPVYENIKKFNSNSCGNVKDDIHPKCKVSLHARLSGEGVKTVNNNMKHTFDKGSQTDLGKHVLYEYDSKLKSYSNLSGLAKLASEIKNDAFNLNSKIAIETLNSKQASEANSKLASAANSEASQYSKNSQHTKEEELYSYAIDLYNPGHNSPRSSLYSIPSLDWDRRLDYTCRSRSLPRQKKTKEQRLYRTQSHSGFVNARIKDPEPTHFHLPRCNSCGATNVSYNWELIREELSAKYSGRKIPTSMYMSVDNIHQKCDKDELCAKSSGRKKLTSVYISVDDIHQKCQEEASKVTVTAKVVPVYKVATLEEEFVDSQEFNEDNYFGDIGGDIGNSFSSNQTVIERVFHANDTLKGDVSDMQKGDKTEFDVMTSCGTKDDVSDKQNGDKVTEFDVMTTCGDDGHDRVEKAQSNTEEKRDYIFGDTNEDDNVYRAEYVILDEVEEMGHKDDNLSTEAEYLKVAEKDNTLSTEGEYHSFTDEIDFDSAYISPVKDLVEKDIRDYSVPIGFYCDDYKKEQSPKKPQSPKRPVTPKSPVAYGLEPILEESKSSYGDESGNLSNSDAKRYSGETSINSDVRRNSGESTIDKSLDVKTVIKVDLSGISQNIEETSEEYDNNFEHILPEISKASDRNANEIENIHQDTSERDNIDDHNHQQIRVKISLSKPQYEKKNSGIEVLYSVKSQFTEEDTTNDVQNPKSYIEKHNNIVDTEIIHENLGTVDTLQADMVKDVLQDIFTTAVTAVQLKSELTSSSLKVTPEFLNSELNKDRDSYLIAEEDDFTTNDIESIATNVVQTAIDVYAEGEGHIDINETDIDEVHDTDIMNCVYDDIFYILSEEAISSNDFKPEICDTANDRNSLELNVEDINKNHETASDDQEQSAQHNDESDSSNMNDITGAREEFYTVDNVIPEAEKHEMSTEDIKNDVQDDLLFAKPSIDILTESSMICIKGRQMSFDSCASSVFDTKSFDSTAEFEKYEAVSEVLSFILNKIDQTSSCEIFNNFRERHVVTNFEFDRKRMQEVDEFITDEPKMNLELQLPRDLQNIEKVIHQDDVKNLNTLKFDMKAVEKVDEYIADEPMNLKLLLPCDLQNTGYIIHQNDVRNVETNEIGGTHVNQLHSIKLQVLESVISFNSEDNRDRQNNNKMAQIDTENFTHSIIIELPYELQDDVKDLITDVTGLENLVPLEVECIQPEIEFSIAKIIQDIEHNNNMANLNETVSTETSETEDSPQKVGEALMYYIFDRVFCSLGEKRKSRNNGKVNVKKVVTIVDSEDILFTAKCIWKADNLENLPIESYKPADVLEILESDKPADNLENIESVGILESYKPAEDLGILESDKPTEDLEVLESDKPAAKLESAKSILPADDLEILVSDKRAEDLEILESDSISADEIYVSHDGNISVSHDGNFSEQINTEVTFVQLQSECKVPTESECNLEVTILDFQEPYKNQIENVDFDELSSTVDILKADETHANEIENTADTSKKVTKENSKSNTDICEAPNEKVIDLYLDESNLSEHEGELADPDLTHTDPILTHTDPLLAHPDPGMNHPDPGRTHTYPDLTHTDPGMIHADPDLTHPDPGMIHRNCDLTHTYPVMTQTYPHLTQTYPHLTYTDRELTHTDPGLAHTDPAVILDCNEDSEASIAENIEYSFQYENFNTTFDTNSYEHESHETGNVTGSFEHDINKKSHSNDLEETGNSNKSRDSNDSKYSNESINNTTYNLSDAYNESFDMASEMLKSMMENSIDYSECSKAENVLNQTFILEKSSDNSMNTAFVVDSPTYDRSSSPEKVFETSVFGSCSESPIKNSDLENSVALYEKEDTLLGSPFVKRASVISMSQTVNTGGVKYWVSFDDSLTESLEKTTYRSIRKSRSEMPSFVSVDFTKNHDDCKDSKEKFTVYERDAKRRNSVLLDDNFNQSTDTKRTEDSYATTYASISTDYHTCESDFTDSKTETEPQRKLLYNSSTDLHTRSSRREYNSWPPYENTLYYKIISKFRMSESFDAVDFENIKIDDPV